MLKDKNIIIFGGTGFVGEYLVKLLKRIEIQVFVIYNNQMSNKEKKLGVKYYKLDLTKNSKVSPSIIKKIDTAVIMTQPNDLIMRNIIKILNQANTLKKIIYISTILVYPSSSKKIRETTTPAPESSYEKGKIKEEKLLTNYAKRRNIKLNIIRLANVYGNKKNRGIIGIIFNSILNDRPIVVNGNGNQIRDYIFVEDAVKLINFLIFSGQKNLVEIFNICTGQGYTIQDLIKLAKKITKNEMNIKYSKPVKEKMAIVGDNKKILKVSKVRLSYDIIKGLKKTYLNYNHERI